jgi:hypothetical protein
MNQYLLADRFDVRQSRVARVTWMRDDGSIFGLAIGDVGMCMRFIISMPCRYTVICRMSLVVHWCDCFGVNDRSIAHLSVELARPSTRADGSTFKNDHHLHASCFSKRSHLYHHYQLTHHYSISIELLSMTLSS